MARVAHSSIDKGSGTLSTLTLDVDEDEDEEPEEEEELDVELGESKVIVTPDVGDITEISGG